MQLWKWRGCGKREKLSSHSPLEISPNHGEIPTFPQLRRRPLSNNKKGDISIEVRMGTFLRRFDNRAGVCDMDVDSQAAPDRDSQ